MSRIISHFPGARTEVKSRRDVFLVALFCDTRDTIMRHDAGALSGAWSVAAPLCSYLFMGMVRVCRNLGYFLQCAILEANPE